MSEEYGQGYQGQPAGSTMAPPPPPPPPGVYAPAQAPQPAPKKKRTGLIVVIVLAVLLCGLGACAAAGLALFSSDGDADTITQAESHFSAMMSAVETASAQLEGLEFDASDVASTQAGIDEAGKSLRVGRDEIAAARASIEQLDESQGRTDYLASLDAANESLDGLEDMLAYLGKGTQMMGKMSDASKAAQSANDLLNSAISAGNSSKYSTMRTKASDASAKYAKAARLFDEAHAVDESAGLDQAAKYARKRKQVADVVVGMAKDGKAGRVSDYNAGIKKMKKLDAEVEKIGEPAIVKDDDWLKTRLADLSAKITTAGDKADQLHAKALEELN